MPLRPPEDFESVSLLLSYSVLPAYTSTYSHAHIHTLTPLFPPFSHTFETTSHCKSTEKNLKITQSYMITHSRVRRQSKVKAKLLDL